MDDFAVFVNDYLTPDHLSVQEYSCVSWRLWYDVSLACRLKFFWLTPGLFQSVMDLDNVFSIDAESLTMKVRLRGPRTPVSSDWTGDGGYWFNWLSLSFRWCVIQWGSRKTYVTALAGEDNSLELNALAPATYAIFKLKGPATVAVWGSFHSAKKHCEMID